jgi:hypothetical protein
MLKVDQKLALEKEGEFHCDYPLPGDDKKLVAWVNHEGNLELEDFELRREDIPRFQKFLNEWYGEAK